MQGRHIKNLKFSFSFKVCNLKEKEFYLGKAQVSWERWVIGKKQIGELEFKFNCQMLELRFFFDSFWYSSFDFWVISVKKAVNGRQKRKEAQDHVFKLANSTILRFRSKETPF